VSNFPTRYTNIIILLSNVNRAGENTRFKAHENTPIALTGVINNFLRKTNSPLYENVDLEKL
jgi:hypothetical protein